jgi:glucose/arabinose dehydrogenase
MKRISLATLSVIGLAILACGGGDEEATTTTTTPTPEPAAEPTPAPAPEPVVEEAAPADGGLVAVALTEPWSTMGLPINDGVVVASDKTMMLVAYTQGAISTYTASYSPLVEKAGYAKVDDYSTPEFTAYLYKKGTQQIGFAVGQEEGYTFVYMEDLDGVPEDQRVVKKGSTGVKKVRSMPRHPNQASHGGGNHGGGNHGGGGNHDGGGKAGKGKGKGKGKHN